MASNSHRRSGSSGRSTPRKRVVIGAHETVRVRYRRDTPEVESERRTPRTGRKARPDAAGSAARAGKRLSNTKREERERRQRAVRLRRVAFVALVAALVGLLAWGLYGLYRAPVLPIKRVLVSGARHYDEATIRRLAAVPAEATMVRVPVSAIERRLEADPWIAEAKVERDFPDTLRIAVRERSPVAVVDAGGKNLWLVSSDLTWLGRRSAEGTGLVVVRGVEEVNAEPGARLRQPEVVNAVKAVGAISPELRKQVVSVSAPTVDETAFKTKDDVEIFVGEATKMAQKDRIVRQILEHGEGRCLHQREGHRSTDVARTREVGE